MMILKVRKKIIILLFIGIIVVGIIGTMSKVDINDPKEHHRYCKFLRVVIYQGQERGVGVCNVPRMLNLLPKKTIYEELHPDIEKSVLKNRLEKQKPEKIDTLIPFNGGF